MSKVLERTWKDPNAHPIPYDRQTMRDANKNFTENDVEQVYNDLKKTGGKKKKRITIKKKKQEKP